MKTSHLLIAAGLLAAAFQGPALADGVPEFKVDPCANNQMLVVERDSGKVLSRFSRPGRMAGELKWVHNMAIDSKGNLYTAEVGTGRRAQKFARVQ